VVKMIRRRMPSELHSPSLKIQTISKNDASENFLDEIRHHKHEKKKERLRKVNERRKPKRENRSEAA